MSAVLTVSVCVGSTVFVSVELVVLVCVVVGRGLVTNVLVLGMGECDVGGVVFGAGVGGGFGLGLVVLPSPLFLG